jgi:hypothetical protein
MVVAPLHRPDGRLSGGTIFATPMNSPQLKSQID